MEGGLHILPKTKLNLGCGNDYRYGWLNCDKANVRKDVELDLEERLPFYNNSIDHIDMIRVLEKVKDPLHTLYECYRILKKGGTMKIEVSYYNSILQHMNLTHKSTFSEYSFDYCDKKCKDNNNFQYGFKFDKIEITRNYTKIGKTIISIIGNPNIFHYIPNCIGSLTVRMTK